MDRELLEELSPAANAPNTSSASASDLITAALESKRKQVDAEIFAFKTLKDKEYAEYERQLRKTKTPTSPSSPIESNVEAEANSKSSAVNRSHSPTPTTVASEISERSRITHHRTKSNDRRLGRQTRTAQQALMQAFGGTAVSQPIRQERGEASQTDKQREWEGVFTPGYLSLIDGNGHTASDQPSSSTHSLTTPSTAMESTQVAASDPTPSPTTTAHLQPQPQPLSSSAPTRSPTHTHTPPSLDLGPHNRSDSTNSVLSAGSLRSSLKDANPKQPKSPKRVLFSIDDGVLVSPSTSPALSRKANASALSDERVSNAADVDGGSDSSASLGGGRESVLDFGIGIPRAKRKNRRKERSRSSEGSGEERGRGRDGSGLEGFGVSEGRGFMDLVKGWETPISAGDAAAAQGALRSNGLGTTPGPLGFGGQGSGLTKGFAAGDDQGGSRLGDDDLFAFDEEISGNDAYGKGKDAAGDEVKKEADHVEEDGPEAEKSLTGTSPHAGSLPIEIKWSQRRGILDDG
ncbi:MAG: hypothetical protein OHK93_008284 [Ramalina farinacea]|uniref:Uncharacterized protein n=1 Tax=Ramalina farinacea TaxID=258253 RepID=A0AA43QNB6_9LECA|nr:hypothetical protein [Ramalina farinacea]